MDGYLDRLSRTFSDHRVQLVTAAVAASAATASAMWGTRHIQRRQRARKLKKDTVFGDDSQTQARQVTKHTPISLTPNEESLIREQLARHYAFLGDDGMKRLRDSFVVVVGAGGVGSQDYVLDCIDNMDTKLDLIMYCKKHNLPVISAMGAGMKSDPSRVQIADIGDTFEDPMSRAGVESGVKVIYSTEKPGKVGLEQPGDFSVLPDFRVRIVPVLGTMPAMFGIAMGTHILTELAGFPTDPLAIKGRNALYARLHRELGNREHQLWMSPDDVGYILEEIWRGKSAISGSTDKLALVRWKRDLPMTTHNCIVMTKKEADEHEKIEGNPEDVYPAGIIAFINERFEEERRLSQLR
ncbi:hypothetical protein DL89DRAFT_266480 [Linderina pennispora]|uniref:THIF-type NAD/FAD binding fold domain-containing protein n=1 Tax=Linderina pennispora TaxID=61395 RepID=A0A1Y1WD31_9FUNG|nr:uncharacterized protein DL89DRAFT_266480 [Linderina pennispora]ORX71457.1 hypothetical protein DL89DRAFT_266480 [Linderina pennispora]